MCVPKQFSFCYYEQAEKRRRILQKRDQQVFKRLKFARRRIPKRKYRHARYPGPFENILVFGAGSAFSLSLETNTECKIPPSTSRRKVRSRRFEYKRFCSSFHKSAPIDLTYLLREARRVKTFAGSPRFANNTRINIQYYRRSFSFHVSFIFPRCREKSQDTGQ